MFIGLFFAYFSIIQSAKAVTIASLLVLTLVLSDVLLEYGPAEDQISMLREFFVAYTLLGCAFILLERFFLHYMESFGLQNIANSIKEGKKEKLTRTLIYGGGAALPDLSANDFQCKQAAGQTQNRWHPG